MSRKRRKFDGAFKARVALDAIRGLKTISELASIHKAHPTQIALWMKQLLEEAAGGISGLILERNFHCYQ